MLADITRMLADTTRIPADTTRILADMSRIAVDTIRAGAAVRPADTRADMTVWEATARDITRVKATYFLTAEGCQDDDDS